MGNVADEATIIRTRLQQQVEPKLADLVAELQLQTGQMAQLITAVEAQVGIVSGEWSPTVVGGTTAGATTYNANGQVGRYRKIGDSVFFSGRIDWSAATGTGDLRISLPFASANITNMRWTVSIVDAFLTWSAGSPPIGIILPNQSYFTMVTRATGAAFNTVQVDTNAAIAFSGWYMVA